MVPDRCRVALESLPWVFHVADLTLRLGWKPPFALQELYRWSRQGLVYGFRWAKRRLREPNRFQVPGLGNGTSHGDAERRDFWP